MAWGGFLWPHIVKVELQKRVHKILDIILILNPYARTFAVSLLQFLCEQGKPSAN